MLGLIIPARALPSRRQVPFMPDGSLLISKTRTSEAEIQRFGRAKDEGDSRTLTDSWKQTSQLSGCFSL